MKNQSQSESTMIRLTYVSRKHDFVSDDDVNSIASNATIFNRENDITGLLICSGKVFFQVLEGNEDAILRLFYEKIYRDKRHSNIIKIQHETISQREYSEWNMKLINLNEDRKNASDPVRSMLNSLSNKVLESAGVTSAAFEFVSSQNRIITNSSQTVDKIVFFSDIVSFSLLSENLEPMLVIGLLNKYIKVVTGNIVSNGGRVSKILGDGVMAYFDSDHVDNAVNASTQILSDLQDLRYTAYKGSAEKVLYTGIGLASGPVIEGSTGLDVKDDYTIIGDSVNLASRLEAMTRTTKKALIFSEDIKNKLGSQWEIVELGKHIIKGKDAPMGLYSVRSQFTKKVNTGIELEWEIGNYLQMICKES